MNVNSRGLLRRTMRRFSPGSLSLAVGALLVSLYLVEGALRLYYVLPTPLARYYPLGLGVAGSSISTHQREYDVTLTYNLAGFRDAEIPSRKVADTMRILFLGDSFVEGFGVEVRERFSSLVVRMLDRPGPLRYEAVNAAQAATDPLSYYDNLITFGLALRPDAVVMGSSWGTTSSGRTTSRLRALP